MSVEEAKEVVSQRAYDQSKIDLVTAITQAITEARGAGITNPSSSQITQEFNNDVQDNFPNILDKDKLIQYILETYKRKYHHEDNITENTLAHELGDAFTKALAFNKHKDQYHKDLVQNRDGVLTHSETMKAGTESVPFNLMRIDTMKAKSFPKDDTFKSSSSPDLTDGPTPTKSNSDEEKKINSSDYKGSLGSTAQSIALNTYSEILKNQPPSLSSSRSAQSTTSSMASSSEAPKNKDKEHFVNDRKLREPKEDKYATIPTQTTQIQSPGVPAVTARMLYIKTFKDLATFIKSNHELLSKGLTPEQIPEQPFYKVGRFAALAESKSKEMNAQDMSESLRKFRNTLYQSLLGSRKNGRLPEEAFLQLTEQFELNLQTFKLSVQQMTTPSPSSNSSMGSQSSSAFFSASTSSQSSSSSPSSTSPVNSHDTPITKALVITQFKAIFSEFQKSLTQLDAFGKHNQELLSQNQDEARKIREFLQLVSKGKQTKTDDLENLPIHADNFLKKAQDLVPSLLKFIPEGSCSTLLTNLTKNHAIFSGTYEEFNKTQKAGLRMLG